MWNTDKTDTSKPKSTKNRNLWQETNDIIHLTRKPTNKKIISLYNWSGSSKQDRKRGTSSFICFI